MAEKLDLRQVVTFEELLRAMMYQLRASLEAPAEGEAHRKELDGTGSGMICASG